ncbi:MULTISPECIES: GntR family transcriptional regulator [Pandoraea]|uniref:GntR family transcriptional regulator n=1 Tax=Pandoraea TaxID=93217 RepID=UPI001F5C7808|nr:MULTISPECIES: GntR family transcriptional regulator [Pandoraea]MCI3206760.1 GntR family transcriptional regulator [Pandoraea sp. LA3]MDN4584788.1 GntR family transcriptional regulator [Pandoraea capi]
MLTRRLKLEPDSPVPLYAQIKDMLRSGILDGHYAPLSRMPSESELQAMFDVSRITIRQALGDLQKEGLIFKVHGKGSFVSQPKAFQNVTSLQGFAEAMSRQGHEIVNRVMHFRFVPAAANVAHRLGVDEGATVTEIHRVRRLNRAPVSYEITYLPEALGRQLQRADLVTRDIFLILENDCAVPLGSADLSIDAVQADAALASALDIAEGAPLLRIERLTHDKDGRPVDFEFLYFRSDTFQYRLRVDREHAKPSKSSPKRR